MVLDLPGQPRLQALRINIQPSTAVLWLPGCHGELDWLLCPDTRVLSTLFTQKNNKSLLLHYLSYSSFTLIIGNCFKGARLDSTHWTNLFALTPKCQNVAWYSKQFRTSYGTSTLQRSCRAMQIPCVRLGVGKTYQPWAIFHPVKNNLNAFYTARMWTQTIISVCALPLPLSHFILLVFTLFFSSPFSPHSLPWSFSLSHGFTPLLYCTLSLS